MAKLIQTVLTISPLEYEIMNIGMAELILMVLTIVAHWITLELEMMNMGMAKLIQTVLSIEPIGVHWSCRFRTTLVELRPAYHWSPLESIGVEYRHR